MKQSDYSAQFPVVWASGASSDTVQYPIPTTTSEPGRASLNSGFPKETMTPLGAGGAYARGSDVNGGFRMASTSARNYESGVIPPWSASFAQSIGGYPMTAIVSDPARPGIYWRSTVDDNMSAPGSGAGWVNLFLGLTPTSSQTNGTGPLAISQLYRDGTSGKIVVNSTSSTGSPLAETLVTLSQFKTVRGPNSGYRILPDGTITQWGIYTTSQQDGTVIVYFPLPFPNKCSFVTVCEARAGGSWFQNQPTFHGVFDAPATGNFEAVTRGIPSGGPVTATGYFYAEGY